MKDEEQKNNEAIKVENTNIKENLSKNKNKKYLIIIIFLTLVIISSIIIKIVLNKTNERKEDAAIAIRKECKRIVNEYGKYAEKAVNQYMLENKGHVPKYSEIENMIEYTSYKVDCDQKLVNYDGTVYLNNCAVKEYNSNKVFTYGDEKIIGEDEGKVYIYSSDVPSYIGNTMTKEITRFSGYTTTKNKEKDDYIYKYDCFDIACKPYDYSLDKLLVNDNGLKIIDMKTKKEENIDLNIDDSKYTSLSFITSEDTILGIAIYNNEIMKSGFYSLKAKKRVTELEFLNHKIGTTKSLAKDNLIYASRDGSTIILDASTGKTKKILGNTIDIVEKNIDGKILYFGYDNKTVFNEKFEPFANISYNKNNIFVENSDKTISYRNISENKYVIYDKDGNVIRTSKEYDNLILIKDYIIHTDKDNNIKIFDLKDQEVVTIAKIEQNQKYHSKLTGWIYKTDKAGENLIEWNISVTLENEKQSNGSDDKTLKYLYNPETKKITVEKHKEVPGYDKPVLYIYPKKKTNVTVTFEHPELLTTTYPKYNKSWKVTANKNGDLYDSNRKYYYGLYWEEKGSNNVTFDEGFYVTKDNAIEFLEEKLHTIGLNDKEKNEFIMYWLPILEKNEKSIVYFELTEERNSYNKLIIKPKPDSMLRIAIHVKKVNQEVRIREQILKPFKRKGFTAVEWGGVNHN